MPMQHPLDRAVLASRRLFEKATLECLVHDAPSLTLLGMALRIAFHPAARHIGTPMTKTAALGCVAATGRAICPRLPAFTRRNHGTALGTWLIHEHPLYPFVKRSGNYVEADKPMPKMRLKPPSWILDRKISLNRLDNFLPTLCRCAPTKAIHLMLGILLNDSTAQQPCQQTHHATSVRYCFLSCWI
jgi:hypothetical protein